MVPVVTFSLTYVPEQFRISGQPFTNGTKFLAERKEALDRWGAHVERAVQRLAIKMTKQPYVEPAPKCPTGWCSMRECMHRRPLPQKQCAALGYLPDVVIHSIL
jgi:hypothetical protein